MITQQMLVWVSMNLATIAPQHSLQHTPQHTLQRTLQHTLQHTHDNAANAGMGVDEFS